MANHNIRPSNFYDSKFLAEYYDLWVEGNSEKLDTQKDAITYFNSLKEQLETRQPPVSSKHPFRVLDVGTGTGRVLLNLTNDAEQANISGANLEMYGIDTEAAMLEYAEKIARSTPAMARLKHVQWILGEAQSLTTTSAVAVLQGQIDMFLFAVGSISLLHDDGEPLAFLHEVRKLLLPGYRRAIMPIQDDLIAERSVTAAKAPEMDTWAEVRDAEDFESRLYPGVVYRQLQISGSRMERSTKIDTYSFLVVEANEAGTGEHVVETNEITVKLRVWKEDEWLQWIEQAGLECEHTFRTRFETFYVLR